MVKGKDIRFSYSPEGDSLFKDLSFHLEKGEIGAILGRNGTGKTTLLKCLLGILPLSCGSVTLGGAAGYVPQQVTSTFAYSTLDMVVMGRARHIAPFSSPGRRDYEIAEAILEKLGLSEFRNRSFTEISGGERQMILIARALASDCSILILDEPTSALDFKNQNKVLQTLVRLSRNEGMTVLFTTHSPNQAVFAADKALLMYSSGKYIFDKAEKSLSDESLRRLYELEIRKLNFEHEMSVRQAIIPVFG